MLRREYVTMSRRSVSVSKQKQAENVCSVTDEGSGNICWYVMTGYALDKRRGVSIASQVARYNEENGTDLELFAPTFVKVYNVSKDPRRRMLPLTCQYFFLRGTLEQVKGFRAQNAGYNLIHNRTEEEPETAYLYLTDEDMAGFRALALAYKYNMPCFSPLEVDLVACDKVRIVGGEFAGVEGYLVSQQGRDGGRVIINVGDRFAVQTLDINPKYIQILSFAKGGKRIYDKIDSYIPKLRRAMEYFARNGELDVSNTAAVSFFITRFGAARIATAKMRAKVSALLMTSYYLMGDTERYEVAKQECLDVMDSCTNPSTRAYILGLSDFCARDGRYRY